MHGDKGSAVIDDDELVYFHAAGVGQEADAYGGGENQSERVMEQYGGGSRDRAPAPTLAASPWRIGTR